MNVRGKGKIPVSIMSDGQTRPEDAHRIDAAKCLSLVSSRGQRSSRLSLSLSCLVSYARPAFENALLLQTELAPYATLGDSPDIRCKITLSGTLKWMIMFNGLPCALSAESSKSAWRRVRGKPSRIQLCRFCWRERVGWAWG
jgi:hypothetical protein